VPPPSTILNTLLQAASGDTLYEPEVPGGHTRSDGIDIKWEVRWVEKKGTSQLSLFCCDMIRRGSLRVRRPLSSKSHLTERICQLGVDLVRINHSTPRGHRTIASARPEHICGRLFRAQREVPIEVARICGCSIYCQVTSRPRPQDLKFPPRLLPCEPDASEEAEVQFLESHHDGAGLFEVGVP
jgi:hypothetical protein